MKNNYAICFSLYDYINISDKNLYWYKGILYCLSFEDRDFDIYIDTTEYCKNILLQIVNQEKLNIDNVYFIIHDNNDLNFNIWSLKTLIDQYNNYDIIGIYNSSYELGENFISIINKNLSYSLYSVLPQTINNNLIYNYYNLYINCDTFFIRKNTNINIKKIHYCINEYYNLLLKIKDDYICQCNMLFYNYLLIDLIYDNDILYINQNTIFNKDTDYISKYQNVYNYTDKKWYYPKKDIHKSINYNNGYYTLNNNSYCYDYNYVKNTNLLSHNTMYSMILKHINLQTMRYILGYINEIDYNNWNINEYIR